MGVAMIDAIETLAEFVLAAILLLAIIAAAPWLVDVIAAAWRGK